MKIKKILSIILFIFTIFILNGCYQLEVMKEIRSIEPDVEGYIFVGNTGLSINNESFTYKEIALKRLRKEVINPNEYGLYYRKTTANKQFFLHHYSSNINRSDYFSSSANIALISIDYEGNCTIHKIMKNVSEPARDYSPYSYYVLLSIINNHSILNYNNKIEIFDVVTNKVVFQDDIEKIIKFNERVFVSLNASTITTYEYNNKNLIKHQFTNEHIRSVNYFYIYNDNIICYFSGYDSNYQMQNLLVYNYKTNSIMDYETALSYYNLARNTSNQNEAEKIISDNSQTYHYSFEENTDEDSLFFSTKSLILTRDSDGETRIIGPHSLYYTNEKYEKLTTLWEKDSVLFPFPVSITTFNGKILICFQSNQGRLWMRELTPIYVFEYDFDNNTYKYAGFYEYKDGIFKIIKK